MFGKKRRQVSGRAHHVSQAMRELISVCSGKTYEDAVALIPARGYVKLSEIANSSEKVAQITKGQEEVVYYVREQAGASSGNHLQVSAEGHGRLHGLMLIGDVRSGEVTVKVSGVLAVMRVLGRDTLPMRDVMLGFPGFTNTDASSASIAAGRR
jgi:hypothetical protein